MKNTYYSIKNQLILWNVNTLVITNGIQYGITSFIGNCICTQVKVWLNNKDESHTKEEAVNESRLDAILNLIKLAYADLSGVSFLYGFSLSYPSTLKLGAFIDITLQQLVDTKEDLDGYHSDVHEYSLVHHGRQNFPYGIDESNTHPSSY